MFSYRGEFSSILVFAYILGVEKGQLFSLFGLETAIVFFELDFEYLCMGPYP